MKKLKIFDVYLESEGDVYKTTVPADSKKAAEQYAGKYGMEIVTTKESPLQDIDLVCLADTLKRNGWGKQEIETITRTIELAGLERK